MPIKQAAKKALRQADKHQAHNLSLRNTYKWLVKELQDLVKAKDKKKATETAIKATKAVDKAAKKHVIHKNKAARLKSQVDRAVNSIDAKKK